MTIPGDGFDFGSSRPVTIKFLAQILADQGRVFRGNEVDNVLAKDLFPGIADKSLCGSVRRYVDSFQVMNVDCVLSIIE